MERDKVSLVKGCDYECKEYVIRNNRVDDERHGKRFLQHTIFTSVQR
jgi:hypothetical protein